MARGRRKTQPETLRASLENYTVPTLKGLAKLMASRLPPRKAELVALIQKRLEDPASLQQLWEELDTLQQAAVAEVVHSSAARFDAAGFRAKYGADPNWGQLSRWGSIDNPSLLCLFIYISSPGTGRKRLPPRPTGTWLCSAGWLGVAEWPRQDKGS